MVFWSYPWTNNLQWWLMVTMHMLKMLLYCKLLLILFGSEIYLKLKLLTHGNIEIYFHIFLFFLWNNFSGNVTGFYIFLVLMFLLIQVLEGEGDFTVGSLSIGWFWCVSVIHILKYALVQGDCARCPLVFLTVPLSSLFCILLLFSHKGFSLCSEILHVLFLGKILLGTWKRRYILWRIC